MGRFRGFLKSSFRVFSGFLDAIVGIAGGKLTFKEAKNWTKGTRAYQKSVKEAEEKKLKAEEKQYLESIAKNLEKINKQLSEEDCMEM